MTDGSSALTAIARDDAPQPLESGPPAVITTTGLRKTYPGGLTAVESLDLTVRQG